MKAVLSVLLSGGLLGLGGCDSSSASTYEYSSEIEDSSEYGEEIDGAGEEVKAGETYSEFDDRRDSLDGAAGSFGGYGCTVDCSGHEAGYEWAEEQGIEDEDDCGGTSWSFEEGCRQYAAEQSEY